MADGGVRDEIRAEADRLEENATFGQQGNLEAAKLRTGWSWALGSVIAVGSAVGGVLTFATDGLQYLAGGLALLAAAATGVHGPCGLRSVRSVRNQLRCSFLRFRTEHADSDASTR
ncbi:hypothetical protein [Curtobacterium flaccumfaciens]|uniref:hypothetical protein n=1 Tax=Curtobacterium flaccumfaciens TaxID=2035 RepID=UPI00220DFC5A|nr:hypothetical protein [Curtobacterium flaccumfaciens]MCS0472350.1 hypothetical protein [Curtobacterium flaccumfaciens pv. betae]MCS0473854.1 hypothetical protein [Curtobacterium flaccumfaciens pv. betae]MCS0479090.1 hypothetical protein [Curtobacterium flaccumfaciens pv. betae]MCS0480819.1 hypothetical protein [Curtobacterium flaccumfaciens pv. betae]MCS0485450.1 hypothetical protein [Curtobacterium flaccumfaciens pv. betae]